jgi:hypothetical protein
MNILATILIVSVWLNSGLLCAQSEVKSKREVRATRPYNGKWWLDVEDEERTGFLEGIGDCLTWTAHLPGFSATSNQLRSKISEYYKTHSSAQSLTIVQVWRQVEPRIITSKAPSGGETWKNPHWYLNGLWWRQSTRAERVGFLEGYLSCMRVYVKPQTEEYSRSDESYVNKIDAYLKAHPKGDDEAIADILKRFQDKVSIPKAK